MKDKNKRLCYITLAFVWVFIILLLTFLPAKLSVEMSESVRKFIRRAGIRMDFHSFRSNAHIVVYFFLGIAIALLGEEENWKLSKQFLIGCCVGVLDESIKIVLPKREFDFADILRDGIGILVAVVVVNVACRLRRKIRESKK